jgi:predicted DNA-binding protein (MmcQ/YjbR family)
MVHRQGSPAKTLVRAAAQYPGAYEEYPWGERVAKVNQKVFAFSGLEGPVGAAVAFKLPRSAPYALSLESTEPTSHGLGKSCWVTVHLNHPECPDEEIFLDWLDDSYRAIAPAKLVGWLADGVTR